MSDRLLKLREWLTVDEAAGELSAAITADVSASDILRLALDGFLGLSVNIPAGAQANCGDSNDPERPTRTQHIDGLWDLLMIGAGRLEVESWYNRLRHLPFLHVNGSTGAFVERPGIRCQLPPDRGRSGMHPKGSSAIPDGSLIVVKRVALDALVDRMSTESNQNAVDKVHKPLGERERATLLIIIAALADAAQIDISKPSAAGVRIEALTHALNARVSARTIEEHLKRISEVLDRRNSSS